MAVRPRASSSGATVSSQRCSGERTTAAEREDGEPVDQPLGLGAPVVVESDAGASDRPGPPRRSRSSVRAARGSPWSRPPTLAGPRQTAAIIPPETASSTSEPEDAPGTRRRRRRCAARRSAAARRSRRSRPRTRRAWRRPSATAEGCGAGARGVGDVGQREQPRGGHRGDGEQEAEAHRGGSLQAEEQARRDRAARARHPGQQRERLRAAHQHAVAQRQVLDGAALAAVVLRQPEDHAEDDQRGRR